MTPETQIYRNISLLGAQYMDLVPNKQKPQPGHTNVAVPER